MRYRLVALFVVGLAASFVVAPIPEAPAHPAPYPHRHYYRRTTPKPTYRRTRPRRKVERYDTRSYMYLGIGVLGSTILSDENEMDAVLEGGAGFNLTLGVRFSPYVGFEASWMTSFHSTSQPDFERALLSALTADAKIFIIPSAKRLEPYLQVGLGAYILNRDGFGQDSLSGPGLQVGGGVDINLNPGVSIGGKVLYRGAHMDNADAQYGAYPVESAFLSVISFGADVKLNF